MFTIDASVWVNAESPNEAFHASSRSLLDTLVGRRIPIVVPTLLPIELAGVISRVRGDSALAAQMAAALVTIPTLRWIVLDQPLSQVAADIASKYRLRGADAVYAAVARTYGCTLISLDQEHLTRLASVVRTITPAEALTSL